MIPTPKVAAGGAVGAAAVLITYIASLFGVHLPETVAAALPVLLAVGAAYLKKDTPGKHAA